MKYQASLVGLFSMIDVVMGKPFDKIFKEIPMSQHVKDAITNKPTSPLYDMFQVVLSYEKADWDTLDNYTSKLLLNSSEIPDLYFESVSWANKYVFTVDELEEEERRNNSQ